MKISSYEKGLNMLKVIGAMNQDADAPYYHQLFIMTSEQRDFELAKIIVQYMGWERNPDALISLVHDSEYYENDNEEKYQNQKINPYVVGFYVNIKKINEKEFYRNH